MRVGPGQLHDAELLDVPPFARGSKVPGNGMLEVAAVHRTMHRLGVRFPERHGSAGRYVLCHAFDCRRVRACGGNETDSIARLHDGDVPGPHFGRGTVAARRCRWYVTALCAG